VGVLLEGEPVALREDDDRIHPRQHARPVATPAERVEPMRELLPPARGAGKVLGRPAARSWQTRTIAATPADGTAGR
jgi:hypothetical protein